MNRANSMKQTVVKKTGVKKREGKRTLAKKAIKESIHVAIDGETKQLAQEILNVVGMDMSTAIRIYLKKIISEKAIPFEISMDPFYSKSNLEFLDKSITFKKEYFCCIWINFSNVPSVEPSFTATTWKVYFF